MHVFSVPVMPITMKSVMTMASPESTEQNFRKHQYSEGLPESDRFDTK
jgi:hypothetical protein